jgi:hypothetical protein
MRQHKFYNDKSEWYILLIRIRVWSVLRGRIRIRSKTGLDPQHWCPQNSFVSELRRNFFTSVPPNFCQNWH